MSDSPADRRAPKRAKVTLADLTHIVRPPGNPTGIRVYAADELADAQSYATDTNAAVELLTKD